VFGWFKRLRDQLDWRKQMRRRLQQAAPRREPDQIIYYDPQDTGRHHSSFRGGTACWVLVGEDRPVGENFGELPLSPAVYQALLRGPLEEFYDLPHDGMLGDYEEGTLLPDALTDAARVLRTAADSIGPNEEEVICAYNAHPGNIDYRMKLPPEEVRSGFRELAGFMEGAREKGYGVELCL